eukprot:6214087-Pleurochrysis_carterae.AAC.1
MAFRSHDRMCLVFQRVSTPIIVHWNAGSKSPDYFSLLVIPWYRFAVHVSTQQQHAARHNSADAQIIHSSRRLTLSWFKYSRLKLTYRLHSNSYSDAPIFEVKGGLRPVSSMLLWRLPLAGALRTSFCTQGEHAPLRPAPRPPLAGCRRLCLAMG